MFLQLVFQNKKEMGNFTINSVPLILMNVSFFVFFLTVWLNSFFFFLFNFSFVLLSFQTTCVKPKRSFHALCLFFRLTVVSKLFFCVVGGEIVATNPDPDGRGYLLGERKSTPVRFACSEKVNILHCFWIKHLQDITTNLSYATLLLYVY